ncbi:hypothetical protein ES707_03672 [subsurface metagenome]
MVQERGKTEQALLVGGLGGTALGVVIATLLAAKPAAAAPTDEKLDYLIEVLTTLVPVLAEVTEGQTTLITLLQQWLAAQGIEPGVDVSISTPWVAKAPVGIFNQAMRAVGTFDCDRMADYRNGKRILIKVESSLDQGVNIQPVGNIEDSMALAINLGAPLPVAPNGNISVGLAWDDWHPFVGARIIVGVAPTTGRLKVEYSIQE